ncbi:copper-translocating P-type ATPase [Desulfovibrio sp. OttesenSCG-928-C14]|nr:copper-translocating P-type ATPase [Desulfovibrio sp. OttesenSCG-928-C14]
MPDNTPDATTKLRHAHEAAESGRQNGHAAHTGHSERINHSSHEIHAGRMDHSPETSSAMQPGAHADHMAHAGGHTGHAARSSANGYSGYAGYGKDEHAGHGGPMGHMGDLRKKFFVALALAVPIILFSPMMGTSLPFQFSFPGSEWLVLILATVLYFYGGSPFLMGAKEELRQKAPAMMTLISLGITVAYLYSLYAFVLNHSGHGPHVMDFFWELATLIVIMLLGHWVEMNAVGSAGNALQKMAELLPGTAAVLRPDGAVTETPLKDVPPGAKVLVRAGEKMPTDGEVVDGRTTVNESMVTGEAREVAKGVGDTVIGGSINGSGVITVLVTGTGESGYLARVMELVAGAQREKSRAETLSDKVARALFYVALTVGILAFAVWMGLTGNMNTALERMVTVLVIACPHALGLAVPLVVARSTSLGARNGLLVRKRPALEAAVKVTAVLMDKTGTLTEGSFRVSEVRSFLPEYAEDDILAMLGALEQHSNHPLSAGILRAASERGLTLPQAADVTNLPGAGLKGMLAGREALVTSASYLRKNGIAYDKAVLEAAASRGDSISFLILDGKAAGLIAQGDRIKDEAAPMIARLKEKDITPVMLTGDNAASARAVAAQLNLDAVHAELLPEDKEKLIREYKGKGYTVMMVGDGVNDAPALARADVGVAVGAGTDVALDSADIVLVRSNPGDILGILNLARNTARKMVQNLWWGAGYNIAAIPLAAGVLAPFGIILSPAMGAVLMSLSTVVVAVNALTLRLDKES